MEAASVLVLSGYPSIGILYGPNERSVTCPPETESVTA